MRKKQRWVDFATSSRSRSSLPKHPDHCGAQAKERQATCCCCWPVSCIASHQSIHHFRISVPREELHSDDKDVTMIMSNNRGHTSLSSFLLKPISYIVALIKWQTERERNDNETTPTAARIRSWNGKSHLDGHQDRLDTTSE